MEYKEEDGDRPAETLAKGGSLERGSGIFAGASLEGTSAAVDDSTNQTAHRYLVLGGDILLNGKLENEYRRC